jgi:predicted metalloendopeptidase
MAAQLNQAYQGQSIKTIVNYYITRMILNQIPFLDQRFSSLAAQYASTLDGRQGRATRQEECVDTVADMFPMVNDYLYAMKYFGATERANFNRVIYMKGKKGVFAFRGRSQ